MNAPCHDFGFPGCLVGSANFALINLLYFTQFLVHKYEHARLLPVLVSLARVELPRRRGAPEDPVPAVTLT